MVLDIGYDAVSTTLEIIQRRCRNTSRFFVFIPSCSCHCFAGCCSSSSFRISWCGDTTLLSSMSLFCITNILTEDFGWRFSYVFHVTVVCSSFTFPRLSPSFVCWIHCWAFLGLWISDLLDLPFILVLPLVLACPFLTPACDVRVPGLPYRWWSCLSIVYHGYLCYRILSNSLVLFFASGVLCQPGLLLVVRGVSLSIWSPFLLCVVFSVNICFICCVVFSSNPMYQPCPWYNGSRTLYNWWLPVLCTVTCMASVNVD